MGMHFFLQFVDQINTKIRNNNEQAGFSISWKKISKEGTR